MKFVRAVVVFQSFTDGFLGSSSKVSSYLIVALVIVVVSSFFPLIDSDEGCELLVVHFSISGFVSCEFVGHLHIDVELYDLKWSWSLLS